jgi:hypothetical protein
VTTQAPSAVKNARLPEEEEPSTSPVRLRRPIPAARRQPGEDVAPRALEDPDAYDAEESITTRGPAVPVYEDDSVTALAPVTRPAPRTPGDAPSPAPDDGMDGTTRRVAKRESLPSVAPADGEVESITTRAPGHLTNMLRVIATPDDALDDEPPENKTAVMPNAPVKPAGGAPSTGAMRAARPIVSGSSGPAGARAAAIADFREPSSDSGLRVARAEPPSGDHASLSALMPGSMVHHHDQAMGAPLGGGDVRGRDASPAAFPIAEQGMGRGPARALHPSLREPDFGAPSKKPRYGLLVGLVAVLSFAIPLVLFLWLQQGALDASDVTPRAASEVLPDLVARGDSTRSKTTKVAPSATTQQHSGPPGGRGPWSPRRR